MAQFLPYFVARHAAMDLDRQGKRPGLVVNLLVGISALASLGGALIVLFFALVAIGLVH